MPSKTQICNMALAYLGSKATIASINEASNEAAACRLFYDLARDTVLEEHDWGFARKTEAMMVTGQTAPSGWDYEYAWPADCIAPRKIYAATDTPIDFDIAYNDVADKVIVTNEEDASLIYTVRTDVTGLYTPLFSTCLAARLAVDLAIPVTRSDGVFSSAMDRYTSMLMSALRSDQSVRHITRSPTASWIDDR